MGEVNDKEEEFNHLRTALTAITTLHSIRWVLIAHRINLTLWAHISICMHVCLYIY